MNQKFLFTASPVGFNLPVIKDKVNVILNKLGLSAENIVEEKGEVEIQGWFKKKRMVPCFYYYVILKELITEEEWWAFHGACIGFNVGYFRNYK